MLYGKFGISITEKFLKPYNEKLYACKLKELDVDAMGRFFPYAEINNIIDNMKNNGSKTYNDNFIYPKRGASFFVEKLIKKVDRSKILLNSSVTEIDAKAKRLRIKNGDIFSYKWLINTMPLNRLLNVMGFEKTDYSILSSNKVLVFNIGFDEPPINKSIHWTYYPSKNINFYRVGFYNNILGEGALSIYVEIGFKENDEINVKKEFDLTIENLKQVGVIKNHRIVAYNHVVINPGYVHITKESNQYKESVFKDLKENQIYSIGRYGQWMYCSIEDCMIQAENVARNIFRNKDRG